MSKPKSYVLGLLALIFTLQIYLIFSIVVSVKQKGTSSCNMTTPMIPTSEHKATPKLLPVMNPNQNLHDVVKQIILLEQHLFDPKRRCKDCIRKHFATIEALLEETYSLICNGRELTKNVNLQELIDQFRELHILWFDNIGNDAEISKLTCKIRYLRKGLMEGYAEPIRPK
jgi:hypothetical protein